MWIYFRNYFDYEREVRQIVICERRLIMNNKKEIYDETKTYMSEGMAIGMCIGTSLGVVVGIITDNIPLCICFGIGIGICLGLGICSLIKKDKNSYSAKSNDKIEN